MSKLVWRVKLVAELEPGVTTETEVACLKRGEEAGSVACAVSSVVRGSPHQPYGSASGAAAAAAVAATSTRLRSSRVSACVSSDQPAASWAAAEEVATSKIARASSSERISPK